MKILFFGDIVGKIGRRAIQRVLPELKKELQPDLVIANVENLAHGKGVTVVTLNEIKEAGIEICTSGNHIFRKGGYEEILEGKEFQIIRPANYPPGVVGRGYVTLKIGRTKIAVINLIGRVFFQESFDDPLRKLDGILEIPEVKKSKIKILDWHAEASSEKVIMGWYADGRLSAVLGTHTHVPTADARVLPEGTGYISDVGMVGARDGSLGVLKEGPMTMLQKQLPGKFEIPESGIVTVNSVLLEINEETGYTEAITRYDREVAID